eukprot:CAMPEP_0197438204 /NCGR_PEP_ID=MMETSP1175-20131217/5265_1 /TAXON_ID=1003142 /ORGANISM="Triceratium dubium, Strain CCMP147" /LENGTH=513 /DNA_ID=CAMNT_0042967885 /DNA_START=79 /DNA_END=1620 /DNA_ORIENTATION=+
MNGGSSILVLYKVANSGTDHGHYNAFHLPRSGGVTLATVKKHCLALRGLNHLGADGYHWRVRVDEKTPEGATDSLYSWWDIQDENAKLPVKEASSKELERMFSAPKPIEPNAGTSDDMTKAATGALRSLGKAVGKVAGTSDSSSGHDYGPRVPVIAFKLLDLVQMEDKFHQKHHGRSMGGASHHAVTHSRPQQPRKASRPQPAAPAPQAQPRATHSDHARAHAPAAPAVSRQQTAASAVPRVAPPSTGTRRPQPPSRPAPPPAPAPKQQQEASLMDFGEAPKPTLHHTTSSPAAFSNESRAQKLKREYEQKKAKANRVWDEVDQRWVEVDAKGGSVHRGNTSKPPGATNAPPNASKTKTVGISLDASNAAGKSASVQAAVHKRVNEMKDSQQKALEEVRKREMKKKESEAEEDEVRKRLQPKIKAWSEEHGKKKQLRALLASLHTILWPEAGWKQISLGDVLDDSKCKKFYHKATLKVHPDKTTHLDAEKRFLAKRIFDALTQAKVEFDEGKK